MPIYNNDLFNKNPRLLKGNLQIIACAGSGKTDFVSERIAFLLHKGIAQPNQIVAFTFTEKAAEELKFRVREKIGELMGKQPDLGDIYIGTIHAFAFRILQDFIPRYRGYDMLDDIGRVAFLSSIKKDIDHEYLFNSLNTRFNWNFFKHGNKQSWVFRTFIKDTDIFREEGLTEDKAISDSFRKAYKVYLEKLEEKKFLDFSAILRIAVDTLKSNKSILKKVREQFKFYTVDEYQDVNPIQEELIKLLSNQENVCVVGDDDQSIYQWRGANIDNILKFTERYPEVKTHKLETNRRSLDKIVATASELIKKNEPKRLKKSIKDKGIKNESGDLYKILFDTQQEEIDWIIEKINHLLGKEYDDNGTKRQLRYSDMTLLFRSLANTGNAYIQALKAAGIPIVYSGVGGLFQTREVTAIIKCFEYIGGFDKNKEYDDEYLENLFSSEIFPVFGRISLEAFVEGINNLKDFVSKQKRLSLQGLYAGILTVLGLDDEYYHDVHDETLMFNLGRLSQSISDYEASRDYLTYNSIKDFLWFVILHAEKSYDSGNTDAMAGLIDAVQIMTMHGTKGLGFPVVFMPGHFKRNTEPNFGPTLIDLTKVDLKRYLNTDADERRLFYVAITRAKKFLFITSAEYKLGGSQRSSRSKFYDEIPEKHFITDDKKDPTKRKPCKILGVSKEIQFPTSYSELAYYLNCGYDYKMRFVYGFNPELVQALGFGKQIHNIINLLHKEAEDTKKIPTKERVKELTDEHFYMRYASESMEDRLKNSAAKSLQNYVQLWEEDFSLAVKTEQAFEFEMANALIKGSIDMIKRDGADEKILEVIDFKTGKPSNDLFRRYELQIQLYTIAAQEALGKNAEKAMVHYIDSGSSDRQSINTSKAALDNAKEEIKYAINGITTAEFKRDARNNNICKDCDWKTFCPKRKGYSKK